MPFYWVAQGDLVVKGLVAAYVWLQVAEVGSFVSAGEA